MTVTQTDIDALLAGAAGGHPPTPRATTPYPSKARRQPAADADAAPDSATPSGVEAPPSTSPRGQETSPTLERILRIQVPVHVNIAERNMDVATILDMNVGSILEFNKPADSDLQLVVVNACIGTGRAVKVGENFGLHVATIGSMADRIRALGG